jgi:hypothetical protein
MRSKGIVLAVMSGMILISKKHELLQWGKQKEKLLAKK